ncbi:MAG TPA: phosphatase PAP2 family protein, partial [Methylomirabilota bacterium]|nr:phosphatase PAP2 family protein [Methylomirabilota bacterium]
MNWLDQWLVLSVNRHLADRWPTLDALLGVVADSELLKGGLFVALFWYLWFRARPRQNDTRAHVLATLAGAFAAVLVARSLALLLPFRLRPYGALGPGFLIPGGFPPDAIERWSSFPSDHAALFFGFATGIAGLARGLGLGAALYAALVIAWPRFYLGLHWASDLAAGALIGVAVVQLAVTAAPVRRACRTLLALGERRPGPFYALLSLVMFEVGTVFDSVRAFGRLALRAYARAGPTAPRLALAVAALALAAAALAALAVR